MSVINELENSLFKSYAVIAVLLGVLLVLALYSSCGPGSDDKIMTACINAGGVPERGYSDELKCRFPGDSPFR